MKKNVSGFLGFIFALLSIGFCWLPYVGGILWVLAAILSCVGLANKSEKGWSWIGIFLSVAWIIAYVIFGVTKGTFASFTLWPFFQ